MKASVLEALNYAMQNSPFYKGHFADHAAEIEAGINPDLFQKLPFTTKDDITKNNKAICCVEKSKIAEYVTTSGISGKPISIFLTAKDLKRLAENESFSLGKMGGQKKDVYQLLTTMDKQFMAGLAYYTGVLKMGASIVRLGPGSIPLQWKSIIDNEVTKLIAIPSFISKMLDYADQNGIDYNDTKVDSIICIGEPIHNSNLSPNEISDAITNRWKVKPLSTYASTEMATAFYQCLNNKGCHNNDQLLYVEVVGQEGNQVKNGEVGEIVITTLKVEGCPLIRYKTGDLASFWNDNCGCGESSIRIGPITARKNQLIKFKGTTLYPQSFFNIINKVEAITTFHISVEQQNLSCKQLRILLAKEEVRTADVDQLISDIKAHLKITPIVELKNKTKIHNLVYKETNRKPNLISFKNV